MSTRESRSSQDLPATKLPPGALPEDQEMAADAGDADAPESDEPGEGSHKPQRISQKLAQNIPSDPDPDDPVSP